MLALVAALAAASPLDHLEQPCIEEGPYRDARMLLEAHERRHAEMLVMPGFGEPLIVYVWRSVDDTFGARADEDAYIFFKKIQPLASLPRVVTVRAPIDAKTVAALEDLWNVALVDARPMPHPNMIVLDGTRYFFSDFNREYGQRRATTFAADSESTRVGALAKVGWMMVEYARAPEPERAQRAAAMREAAAKARRLFVSDNAAPSNIARLDVDSVPSGARVLVDGKELGRTPALVDVKPNELHVIDLALEGFRTARVEARAPTGVVEQVRAALRPDFVEITISSSHVVDEVTIDGKVVCKKTPCVVSRRPEDGDAKLVITKRGCERYWSTVVVEPVAAQSFYARLRCN